jgi:hypothetical protein
MEKIDLNFFGEQVTIDNPKDLTVLRKKISEKYSLSSSDSAEIILFYIKDSKKIYIINENDLNIFKQLKISTIFLDVNQNSKLYLDNLPQIKNEKEEVIDVEKTKKEIEELKAKSEEILKKQREKRTLYEDKRREIILQKQELEKMDEELSLECAVDMEEFSDKREEINKKIEELKKKIKPKKEEIILKDAQPKKKTFMGPSGQNNFPYNKEAMRKNEEARKFGI